MLKFSVSQRKLPLHYMRQTMPLNVTSPLRQTIANGPRKMHGATVSSSCCEIWKESPTKSAVVVHRIYQTPRKILTPGKGHRNQKVRRDMDGERGRGTPVRRSETIQMKVWSSQLSRLKRKTESLRKKDEEIKERYLEIKRKAKRVISSTGLLTMDGEDDVIPTKRSKLTTNQEQSVIHDNSKNSRINEQGWPQRKLGGHQSQRSGDDVIIILKRRRNEDEEADAMYAAHLLDIPSKRYKLPQKRHRSGSDIPSQSGGSGSHYPVPFPRTFLKNGRKYTIC